MLRFVGWARLPRLFALVLLLTAPLILVACHPSDNDAPRIAHAGGGYLDWQYTNSLEALEFNRDHFELFEIDLEWTADGELVCMHDWDIVARWVFGRAFDTPPTLAEFEALVAINPYFQSCTLETLAQWLERNPDKRLVTDIKTENLRGLERLAQRLDAHADQVIPQIYRVDEYHAARALGFRDIIWTLYQSPKNSEDILNLVDHMDLYAVTMPRRLVESGLARELGRQGVRTYVHTINTRRELKHFRSLGVTEIYTDWLEPK